jgi:hypothetical protein
VFQQITCAVEIRKLTTITVILLKVALNTITLTLCCFVSGIGISMAIISLVVAIYYNVIMAYTLIYLFSSMQKTLPWTVCQDVSTICFNVLYRTRMDTLYNYLSIDHILLIVYKNNINIFKCR